VGGHEKLLERILQGRSDANIGFSDLRGLLLSLGFEERTKRSHHIFRRPDVEERINLQRQGTRPSRIRFAKSELSYCATS
jgi:hypothetical protein